MIVKNVNKEKGVKFTGGISYRPIVKKDNMEFSICKTIIPKGGPYHWWYPNHLEACYCVKGFGILTNLKTNEEHIIRKDFVYALDKHDDHMFEAITDIILISVFNPPLIGNETHDKNGTY